LQGESAIPLDSHGLQNQPNAAVEIIGDGNKLKTETKSKGLPFSLIKKKRPIQTRTSPVEHQHHKVTLILAQGTANATRSSQPQKHNQQ
jgi:hypothetical protein